MRRPEPTATSVPAPMRRGLDPSEMSGSVAAGRVVGVATTDVWGGGAIDEVGLLGTVVELATAAVGASVVVAVVAAVVVVASDVVVAASDVVVAALVVVVLGEAVVVVDGAGEPPLRTASTSAINPPAT